MFLPPNGRLRFAPAWPSGWDVSGTVYIQDDTKVDVQVQGGVLTTAAIVSGASHDITVRNPWPGQQAEIVNGMNGRVAVAPVSAATLRFHAVAGSSYLVEQPSSPTASYPFAVVTGTPATSPKHLGDQQIGLNPPVHYPSLTSSYNDVGITDDTNTAPGNYDGGGCRLSEGTPAWPACWDSRTGRGPGHWPEADTATGLEDRDQSELCAANRRAAA